MKAAKKHKLNTRLLAVFFLAVFVLALGELFIFSHLLGTMEQEEALLNEERLNNAQTKLENAFAQINEARGKLLTQELFYSWSSAELTLYRLGQMVDAAEAIYGDIEYISSYVVLLKGTDYVISDYGVCTRAQYQRLCGSEAYPMEYWTSVYEETSGVYYYPQANFAFGQAASKTEKVLMPLSMESPYNDRFMIVLLLDVEKIFRDSDTYLKDGTYVFYQDTLLYTTDDVPVISRISEIDTLADEAGERYTVQTRSLDRDRITLVKLQPEQEAMAFIRKNFTWCIVMAVGALAAAVVLILFSVRRMLRPVNKMFELIHQHAEAKDPGFRFDACHELEVILKKREQQAAALAQRDAVLSEYFLQSRLKNVYVDTDTQSSKQEGPAYILYIQMQYRQSSEQIATPRAELESCMQTVLSDALSGLFDSSVVFQLEPGRFAARVTLPEGDDRMDSRMARFMDRLKVEQEFAYFTVIQSMVLEQEDDLSAVFVQVQEAARLALVCDQSQLLVLPVPREERTFLFAQEQETELIAYLSRQDVPAAVVLTERILEENLQRGICHTQMEVLCVALVNTAAQAVTKLNKNADKIAAASGVYHVITSRCSTASEHCRTVTDFILSIADGERSVPREDPLLSKVSQYLQENYQREFSSEDLAEALCVSRSYLSTYYKSKTGINLNESIQIFRIQKAVELLQDPRIRISDVGALVGIPSSNTFLRWFRKHTGMTPNEYRSKVIDQ